MILGLDISTSSTGWAVLDSTATLVEQSYIPLGKIKNTLQKTETVVCELKKIKEKYNITNIFIEENLQMFRPGLSSAKVLITLARFNGMVTLLSHQTFDIDPEFLNVNSARKIVELKINKKDKSKTTKEKVFEWVDNELNGTYDWPMKTLKSGPRKGTIIPESGCYDIADAYVIALAGHKSLNK
jgi:Holliday junction resolvasome RuvABC endonuclease subunit